MHRIPQRVTGLVLAVALVAVSAGAQTPAPAAAKAAAPAAPSVQYVKVDGADYAFNVQATIKPGITVFHLVDVGRDNHAMTLLALPKGRTLHDFLTAFNATMKVPAWATPLGETGTIKPGAEAFITARLAAGQYILACLIPAADGRSHTEKGMIQMVTVK